MLIDTKIIARTGARQVLGQRFELAWPDGTMMQSHPVQSYGVIEPGVRALPMPGGRFLLVDLTRLVPQLAEELQLAHERDRPGLIFYTLRRRYKTAAALIEEAAAIGELASATTEGVPA